MDSKPIDLVHPLISVCGSFRVRRASIALRTRLPCMLSVCTSFYFTWLCVQITANVLRSTFLPYMRPCHRALLPVWLHKQWAERMYGPYDYGQTLCTPPSGDVRWTRSVSRPSRTYFARPVMCLNLLSLITSGYPARFGFDLTRRHLCARLGDISATIS